jgi:superfamily II DNA or RNA helicase
MVFDDIPIHELDLRLFSRAARRRLERLAARVDTVRGLWVIASVSDRLAIERVMAFLAAEDVDDGPPPPPPRPVAAHDPTDPPPIGAPEERWRAWARAFAVDSALEEPLVRWYDAWIFRRHPGNTTALAVLTGHAVAAVAVRPAFLPAASIRDALRDRAVQNAALFRAHAAREPARQVAPTDALAPAWQAVSAARDRAYSGMVSLDPSRRSARPAPGAEALHVRAGTESLVVRFEPPALEPPEPALSLLEEALDWLVTRSPEREEVARSLALPPWQRRLDRLVRAAVPAPLPDEEDKRLLGFEVVRGPDSVEVLPVQAREKKRGAGFVTRRVAPQHVPDVLRLDPRDDHALRLLPGDPAAALAALAGHPRVFDVARGDRVPVALRAGRAGLGLRRTASGALRVAFELDGAPFDPAAPGVIALPGWIVDEAAGGLRITPVSPAAAGALAALRGGAPEVPADQLEALLAALPGLAGALPVSADPAVLGPPVPGDDRLVVALRWAEPALGVSAQVQPLPESPPTPPGEGSALVCARREGRVVHHRRDLARERAAAERWAEASGLPADARTGPADWLVTDPQAALGVAERLRADGTIRVRWEGERLRVGAVAARDLRLRVSRKTDWFRVDGDAEVDGARVALQVLAQAALAGHRFVAVGAGHWVALDEALRARLAAVDPAGEGLGPLHAPLLAALEEDGAVVDAPPAWTRLTDRVREARTLPAPPPAGLQAELRPYQREGVEWLARLAHWAPGAVLADDMGLGKTVQAIALLLRRAPGGPALVVAPTSVLGNWAAELARFAPSLRVRELGGPRRAEILSALGPGDVLLATYGLLVSEAAALAGARFETAVLDEAQAIRNPDSQRARAAHALDAGFRLALSGTPVENRTLDLWSVLRFAAPGLLADRPRFLRAFVEPIEGAGDSGRRAALAALVAPFVLRRTKDAVAPELPPRTEIEVRVPLGPEERALYERTRLEALARIEAAGRRRSFQIFEELGRLRRLVCHPRLDDPSSPVPSAKAQQAARLLRDLRDAGHRTLVFSTMVSYLELVRDAVAAEGFTWCWLDGSTPRKRRQEEVERFQSGAADLFFLSLKAGGTGLNLTAANYVVLLDPWWNPAAEDQAADRAHRIGQERAVTVYRLVAADTVEEQIVALHAHKRSLADALLAGAGSTELPDAEAMALILQGSRGDADALAALERKGRPALRLVPSE